MNCDMCGKNIENYYEVNVEGSILKLCKECSSFGKIIKRPVVRRNIHKENKFAYTKPKQKEEAIEIIVNNYYILIKNAREKKGLKQEELAKKLHEKESLISHIESGKKEPRIDLAKKLERFFNIKLIETISEKETFFKDKKESNQLTIGDMIKIKRK